jgi:uncharacterized membrane protein
VHGNLTFRGWFITVLWLLTVALLAGGVLLIIDSLRRPASDFGRLGRIPWVVLQTLFVVVSVFGFVVSIVGFKTALPAAFSSVLGVLIVAAAVQQVAYLLRVVYPSPKRSAGRVRAVPDGTDGA